MKNHLLPLLLACGLSCPLAFAEEPVTVESTVTPPLPAGSSAAPQTPVSPPAPLTPPRPSVEPAAISAPPAPVDATSPEARLQVLVERQNVLLANASKDDANFDPENFRLAMQDLANDYDDFLKKNPNNGPAYAAYGVFLGKVDMRKESAIMLLKANELLGAVSKTPVGATPQFIRTWALVKNQLGNYVAEEGKPLQAINYFISASDLTPNEPLYHYQLGTLLNEARDDFLKSGEWTRAALDRAMLKAFRRAAELAPDRFEFNYRYAESFYDLENPDWDEALKVWATLEEKATTDIERQTMRLQAANVLIKQGKLDHARTLLVTVTEPALQTQKQKLVAQLPAEAAK